jgi:hypothetical protein
MDLMANAIARTRVIQAILGRHILQVDMIVGVAEVPL